MSETMDQSMGACYRKIGQSTVLLLLFIFIVLFIVNNGKIFTMICNFYLIKYIFLLSVYNIV